MTRREIVGERQAPGRRSLRISPEDDDYKRTWNSSPFSWWWMVCCLPVITQLVVASFKASSQSPKCSHLISSHHLCLLAVFHRLRIPLSRPVSVHPSRGSCQISFHFFPYPRPACLIYLLLLLLDSYQSDRQTDSQWDR